MDTAVVARRLPRRPLLTRGAALDVAIAAGAALIQVGGTTLAAHSQHGVRTLDWLGYLLLAAAAAVLVVRRRWPVLVFAATLAATFAYAVSNYPGGPIWAGLIVGLITLLVSGHRVIAYASLPVGYVAFLWVAKLINDKPTPSALMAVGIAVWLLFLPAVTELVRNRRAYAQANRQRALEEQRSAREAARRQASEERLGIARELHDVLAHSLSLINVQAGVALELMEQNPQQVRSALDAIKRTSKDALVDVQGVLSSLRRPDEAVPLTPAPTLRELDDLIRQARTTGLVVDVAIADGALESPAAVDAAAYRIVQEALTNVVRHARATQVAIRLDTDGAELAVTVDDNGCGTAPEVGNYDKRRGEGIAGMRERAAVLGGRLSVGPRPTGGFRVEARLPLALSTESSQP
ncbi:MAG TPA: sensor histidine kinase [Jatrophihabitans sp.]|nr:sensor histidine kinase [Jatrophihabitans sp.]